MFGGSESLRFDFDPVLARIQARELEPAAASGRRGAHRAGFGASRLDLRARNRTHARIGDDAIDPGQIALPVEPGTTDKKQRGSSKVPHVASIGMPFARA